MKNIFYSGRHRNSYTVFNSFSTQLTYFQAFLENLKNMFEFFSAYVHTEARLNTIALE